MVEIGGRRQEKTLRVPDHAEAVHQCLAQLTDPQSGCLKEASEVSAIAFKAVHGGRFSGVQRVTPEVLAAMEEMNDVAPAHNPAYITAMRLLSEKLPEIPLVAAFETGFHQTIPDRNRYFAIPVRVGRRRADPPLRLSRRQPPLHRHANGRTARPGLENHLLPPGRIEFALRDPRRPKHGDQHGFQRPERAAAKQPRGRLRSVRLADDHEAHRQVA